MTDLAATDDLFFNRTGMDRGRVQGLLEDALTGMDDGELFLEYRQSETIVLDDGQIKTASFDTAQGFGLRAIAGESTGYSHASDLSEAAIARAAETVKAVRRGHTGTLAAAPQGTNRALYMEDNPLSMIEFQEKVELLRAIDSYAREKDSRVRQVSASISGNWQAVQIVRVGDHRVADIRPLVRMNVSVVLEQDGRMESGNHGTGGRVTYERYMDPANWKNVVDEAFRQAEVNLQSIPAPAGEVPVVLGPGWPGILLHEAIGHGLEGDFNRKKTSVFSGLMGERVAAPGVTVVDDGTIQDRRGSLTIDDEGTPAENTVLIEDGILKGYMQDRTNARLMGMAPTGNGRRQSYAHEPLPRMTNTVMLGGDTDPEEILGSVKKVSTPFPSAAVRSTSRLASSYFPAPRLTRSRTARSEDR